MARMAEACTGPARFAPFLREPTNRRREAARYVAAALVAATIGLALARAFATSTDSVDASDPDRAILIDLPPALAAARPAREAREGPEQAATTPAVAVPPVEPLKPIDPIPNEAADAESAREKIEHKPEPPAPAPQPSPAMAEQAPKGAETPVADAQAQSEAAQSRASAQAINAWQRALVGRLEVVTRALRGRTPKGSGIAQVAFAVDRDGRVVSQRIALSSGSTALDQAALTLVRRAAPFPTPPGGTRAQDLSFIVPVRFKRT